MTRICTVFGALISSSIALHAAAQTQVTTPMPGSSSPPTTAAADVTACAQAQMVVDSLLASANARLELARQSNNAADMFAAVDALQTTIRDVRAQLAACANAGAADPHAGHAMPGMTTAPGMSNIPPAAPAAEPPATDPHAGHTPAPAKAPPKTAKPPAAKPSTPDQHAGHNVPPASAAPKTTKPATKPAARAKPSATADPHAGHAAPATPQSGDAKVVDPVCGLRVDPATAPSTKHGGQTYHFCSTQHRDLFTKNPAKFLPNKQ
jgi:YHS domain-containing protein